MILLLDVNRTPLKGQGDLVRDELKKKELTLIAFCMEGKIMEKYTQLSSWLSGKANRLRSTGFIAALKAQKIITGTKIIADKE
jgi:hypothetical protein